MIPTLKTLLANRHQRVYPFFVVIGVILLLGGVLLGLRIVLPAHADTQQVNITFNGQTVHLDNNGQATLTVNGRRLGMLTFNGTSLTFTDGPSTITATIGGSATSKVTVNGQTISIAIKGNKVTISTEIASTPTSTDSTTLPVGAVSMVVPAYWGDDEASWNALDQHHLPGTIAIVNIDSGPGSANSPTDNQLANEIQTAQHDGIKVIGYVNTGHFDRGNFTPLPVDIIETNIGIWYNHYAIDGILLDTAYFTNDNLSFYQTLHDYIKSEKNQVQQEKQANIRNTIVIINGAAIPKTENYMKAADILTLFEDDVAKYNLQTPNWIKHYPASKFAITVTGPTMRNAQVMDQVIASGIQQNVGYYYFHETDQGYNQFPAIWNEEYTELSNYNKPNGGVNNGDNATSQNVGPLF